MVLGTAPTAGCIRDGPIWIWSHEHGVHSCNSFGSCLGIWVHGEPSIFPTSRSYHKFHISWLCIVGAIKNVKPGVVGAQTFEMWAASTRTNSRILSRAHSSPHISLTSSERFSREFRSMSATICSLRIGIADGVHVNSDNTAERLRVLTEVVALCLFKELQQRSCASCSVHVVLQVCAAVMLTRRLNMSQIDRGTLICT